MGSRSAQGKALQGSGRKRGRSELRTIRRTAARGRAAEGDGKEEEEEEEEEEGDASDVESSASGEGEDSGDREEQRKEKVYGALLTILKSEHPETNKKRQRKVDTAANIDVSKGANDNGDDDDDEEKDDDMDNHLEDVADEDEDQNGNDNDDDDDDSEDESDPFESHFNQVSEKSTEKLDSAFKSNEVKYKSIKLNQSERGYDIYSEPKIITDSLTPIQSPINKSSIHSYFLKKRLRVHNNLLDSNVDPLTTEQKKLVDPMFQYKDVLYEYDSYGKDEEDYRELYSLHVLNHIYKTRDRILKNNQRLQDNADQEHLDQGFTRPKVLIVAPTRDAAYHIVETLIKKSGIDQVDKKAKFKDQFLDDALPPSSKPKSFRQIFKGNTNDFFVLGIKFTRKAIKLYSNFYQSDIIVCSPLGLQMIVENTDKKKRQDDFLSSIEIMIVDQLHSIEYQNISHVFTIFDHLNKIPIQQHDADFSRIRMWYINDQAKLFRQTMIFTKYISPIANSIINGKCRNWAGRWKNHKIITPEESSIGKLGLKVRQIFQRFDILGGSIIDESEYRFKYFSSVIIPSIVKSTGYEDGILLYVPDYTDYVRVRNYLKDKTSILFGDINEYSEQRQLTANRSLFQQGRCKVLLYTERLHHYRRYEIKGVKSIVFYKPPSDPEFYNEVVRNIGRNAFLGNTDLNISTVRCVYSKLDALSLENIVGSKRAGILCHGQNETYEFK